MIIAKVLGTVVCTQKDEKLVGSKLQVVAPVGIVDLKQDGKPIVVVDSIGAGEGELVLVVTGSSARQTSKTQNTPVDAVIMGIIDSIEVDGKMTFEKSWGVR